MRTSSIFRSRWMALIWAAGILWFAYDFAGSLPAEQDDNATSAEVNQVADALGS